MSFVNRYVAEILKLQVSLYHDRARLETGTDTDALHALRISVRRIRSLLAPVRNIASMAPLRDAAADVGRLTTPMRDLEVLIHELTERGMDVEADRRQSKLRSGYDDILISGEMNELFAQLDEWPSALRASSLANTPGALEKKIEKALIKQKATRCFFFKFFLNLPALGVRPHSRTARLANRPAGFCRAAEVAR